uniref:CCHC-type domain-containing protein n=1 Tax=Tanacetum cinerariifolium TaxID=118510 RepID=A0A6L2JJF4_TANCI|nr:hypothetical protein [Tanacetum cinerariifolium]
MQTQTSNTLHNAIIEAGGKDRPPMLAPESSIQAHMGRQGSSIYEGSSVTTTERYIETYKNVSQDIRDQLNAEAKAVQIILTRIDNDIYSTVDACPNACEMWKAIERFYKMMNVLIGNQYDVTNHQVNVQFLLQLQPEWQRFVTLVKHNQELKTVSYHKLYDILKQHQNEVNEIRAERIARNASPLALVAQQQPVYHPQTHPTHYTQNSSNRSQQAATRNGGKAIVNSPTPIYDQEPSMVTEDDEISKDKEIDKLMALYSLSFKKIYKPINNNLRTSSNTIIANQDNSPRIHRGAGYDNKRLGNVVGARETVSMTVVQKYRIQCYNCKEFGHVARECQKPKREKDVAYHRKKMLLCKLEEAGILLNAEQADWKDDTDDESDDQELEAHYMYMAKLQEVTPDAADNSGPTFDIKPVQRIDQNDDADDLENERELLASLIEKLKCEIDDSKNRNKFLETSNNVLVDKLKETISILSQAKEAQIKLYKTREDKELEKVIVLENKFKVLDNIVYKTGHSVQTMNMLNSKCRTSFAKPEFLKKAQRANPRLYDIGCYNDNLALMSAPESDEVIRLEKENSLMSQLKTQKTQFLNEIDRLSREYYYVDHLNAIHGVYTELDEVTNLQCDNLEMLDKCECLEKELSKSKNMSKSFETLQKHAISLEIKLQQCKEKIKNDKLFKVNMSQEICKEREQYFGIQDLKAQLHDKGIAISELKKLIEKLKEKYVDTNFEKSSVIRQPNAFKSQRSSILEKLTVFSDSLERKDFSKSKSVTKNNVSNDSSKLVTAQILPPNKNLILKNTNVLASGMYKLHIKPTQTRTSQLPNISRKTNKRVCFSTGVIPTTSVSRPQLKSNPIEDRVCLTIVKERNRK